MSVLTDSFDDITSVSHLFLCWEKFKVGKRKKEDVQLFERHLEDHLFELSAALRGRAYSHGIYHRFQVFDPKKRLISKASVRDRLVHHLVYDELVRIFDKTFIYHSFSCRVGKGTHQGVRSLERALRKISSNGTKQAYVLKVDIHRFFDSICHPILKQIIRRSITDPAMLNLIDIIIDSFCVGGKEEPCGLPLGNVTSQVFANIYLHELDFFIKHRLKQSFYFRFCDDFCVVSQNLSHLEQLIAPIQRFLKKRLLLDMHPKKTVVRKFSQGVDFLGYVLLPNYKVVRTQTKKRLKNRLNRTRKDFLSGRVDGHFLNQQLQSYLGLLTHANEYTFATALKNSCLSV